MKLGTPNFIGARLKEAREARGINAISLAEMLGITRSAVSLYENDNTSPQPEMMQKIAEVLNIPISYFIKPIEEKPIENVIFYRSMSSATKTARIRAERWFYWLHDFIIPYVMRFVTLPEVAIPKLKMNDIHKITSEDIEDIATDIRNKWELASGPISNMTLLLENHGVILSRIELCSDTLDAFSVWSSSDEKPYIILGSDKCSSVRSRLDAAHEFGHLVLHSGLNRKQINNSNDFKLVEEQAFRFASAFLLPSKSFSSDLYSLSLDTFRILKSKWLVSIGMMIKRASDLNIISEEQSRRMWINYNRRGWRKEEPLDNTIKIEKPILLSKAFNLINSERVQITEQMLVEIGLSPTDIEKIVGLESGYFNEPISQVNLIKDFSNISNSDSIWKEIGDIFHNYN